VVWRTLCNPPNGGTLRAAPLTPVLEHSLVQKRGPQFLLGIAAPGRARDQPGAATLMCRPVGRLAVLWRPFSAGRSAGSPPPQAPRLLSCASPSPRTEPVATCPLAPTSATVLDAPFSAPARIGLASNPPRGRPRAPPRASVKLSESEASLVEPQLRWSPEPALFFRFFSFFFFLCADGPAESESYQPCPPGPGFAASEPS